MIYDFSLVPERASGELPLRMLVMGAVPHRLVRKSPRTAHLHARDGQTRYVQVWISAACASGPAGGTIAAQAPSLRAG